MSQLLKALLPILSPDKLEGNVTEVTLSQSEKALLPIEPLRLLGITTVVNRSQLLKASLPILTLLPLALGQVILATLELVNALL